MNNISLIIKYPSFIIILLLSLSTAKSQTDKEVYDFIGQRQHIFGATERHISCDSAIKLYRLAFDAAKSDLDSADAAGAGPGHVNCPKTPFETVVQRKRCDFIQQSANKILYAYHIDTTQVYFSLVSNNCFNAMSIPMGNFRQNMDGKWLVEFNIGFSIYSYKMSILCADLTPFSGNEDSLDIAVASYMSALKDDATIKSYISMGAFMLADIAGQPNIESDSISLKTCKNKVVAASLSDGLYSFTLCHELAHIILGHHAQIKKLQGVGISAQSQVDIVKYVNDAEYQADSLGLILLRQVEISNKNYTGQNETKAIEAPFRYAPLIFFTWFNSIQKFEQHFTNHFRGQETHPSAAARRERLLRVYAQLGYAETNVYNYADLMDSSLRYVYDIILPLYKDGDGAIKKLAAKAQQYCPIRQN